MLHNNDSATAQVITPEMILELRRALLKNETAMAVLHKKGARITKAVTKEFLTNTKLDVQLARSISSLTGDLLEQVAISKLSYKLPNYAYIGDFSAFKLEEGKLILAKTILDGLSDLKYLSKRTEVVREVVEGKSVFRNVSHIKFDDEKPKDLTAGIHLEEAQLISKSVHTKPGGKTVKLNSDQKTFMKHLSSMRFRLVRIPEETLREYYKQTEWYTNAILKIKRKDRNAEDPLLLENRINIYVATIKELQERPVIYLSNWFDSRLRLYYELTMLGINPHGDSFETHMWELADGEVTTDQGYTDMIHSAVTIATGVRHTAKATMKLWEKNQEKYITTLTTNPLVDKEVDGVIKKVPMFKFGGHFHNTRLLQAMDDYRNGVESHFLLGEDATTGGLQHGGLGFKSVKSMKASNVGGLIQPQDAHAQLGKEFGLSRDDAKSINTPLLHGSTFKTIAERLSKDTGDKVTQAYVEEHVVQTYGPEILNVPNIATWGTKAYDNYNTTLIFTALDGWKCQSTGYIQAAPLKIYALSLTAKSGYTATKLARDMPLVLTNTGETIYENTKIRGVYANITHTMDGWNLRQVARGLTSLDKVAIFKHDKFYVHPNNMKYTRKLYQAALVKEFEANSYVRAMQEISDNRVGSKIPLPDLIIGEGTVEMVKASTNFLAS